jgi:polyisoprenoid-binding protein YceI
LAATRAHRRLAWWAVAAIIVLAVLAVGVPFVYIHFIEGPAPPKLALTPESPGAQLTSGRIDGDWTVGPGSRAGYRVQEVLAGQPNTAVGRTGAITGGMRISGTTVPSGSVTVDLRTVRSDSSQRDDQFNGRIMDTAQFPNAPFTLTKPVSLGAVPRVGQVIDVRADGSLAMHGVTRPVTATMHIRDDGSTIEINGQIPVVFADWNIENPSFAGFVKTEDNGLIEFLLKTTRTSASE